MATQNKFKMNQSLLSQWLYSYKTENGFEKFKKYLNLEFEPPNKAMLDGTRFEGLVNSALDGQEISEDTEWREQVIACKSLLEGSQKQVSIYKEMRVDGVNFLLHGILDFLRAGEIFDTKFSKTYDLNKYLNSPQTSMYFELVPEAYRFTYVICDGKYIYQEAYLPEQVKPIEKTIQEFMTFLDRFNLVETYIKNWKVK